ncbi:MAG: class I SAM-dependent methyltransferase [Desulfuromonadales bacterium]|nr:class I SAM-dependent methyltransferase [Desulfuromonadales bacterium]
MPGQLAERPSAQDSAVQKSLKSLEFFNELFGKASIKPFAIRLWNGAEWHYSKESPRFILDLKHPTALQRLLWQPSELSLGEAYITDEFDIHGELEASFELAEHLIGRQWRLSEKLSLMRKLLGLPAKRQTGKERGSLNLKGRAHSKQRDAQAVQYHYNVSNDFYKLWLDQRMVYSCAYFHNLNDSLDQAQHNKLDYLCRKLRLKPGERLLDLGCGWGGLIMHAAERYGVEALGVTLSQPQADLANARIQEAGLADSCRAEVCDYRDIPADQQFDKIVSVGMYEHVGEKKLPHYFQKAYRQLKSGGVLLNHGITESISNAPKGGPSFIDKYVFPDGELIPISTSLRIAEETGFEVRDVESLREHYAMTLRLWVKRLEANRDRAIELTSPETYRIWRIYMAGSAYGFETGRLGLYQSLLVKSGRQASRLPLTRSDWYQQYPSSYH